MGPRLKLRFRKIFDFVFVEHVNMLVCLFMLAFAGAVCYRFSFRVPFLFDDITAIVFNPNVQSLEWPWRFLENTRRPLLYATLAFNFHYDGLKTFGYHVFNVRVHVLAAMFLFLLIYQTCRLPRIGESLRRDALLTALGASLIWLCHPVQTQAVTYIIQRAESLMALLFILALFCSARYLVSRKSGWLATAGIAALLCGLTKEVAVALPVTALLYDRAFFSNSFREALKNNRRLYLSLSVTWVVMLALYLTVPPEKIPTAGFAIKDLSVWEYARQQPKVILHYLRLAFWPDPLIFDYQWPLVKDISKLLPSIVVVLAGLGALVSAFPRYPAVSFLGLAFFVVLAPSSSFIPLKDMIWEYRLYLPLSCLSLLFIVALKQVLDRFVRPQSRAIFFMTIVGVLAFVLGSLTDRRNLVYQNEETLWRDVLQKQPANWRIWNDLGSHYYKVKRLEESAQSFLKALELNPSSAEISMNVAMSFAALKSFEQAVFYARKALELSPDFAVGYYNFGVLYSSMGRYDEAAGYFEKAIELGFVDPAVIKNLRAASMNAGR